MNKPIWRRRERRVFSPYLDLSPVLSPVGFTPSGEHDPKSSVSLFLVDAETEPAPHLALALDAERLAAVEPDRRSNLNLAVIVRFPAVRDSLVAGPWPLDGRPDEYRFEDHDIERWPAEYEISVVLVGREPLPGAKDLQNWVRYGAKSFKVATESEDVDFPVRFVDGAAFASEGHSGDALWIVRCNTDDFEQRPEECFEIWINKKADGKLQGAVASGTSGKLLIQDLFSEMQYEIAQRVFANADRPENEDGLCARLTKRLTEGSGLEYENLRDMARDHPERLRSLVQAACSLTSKFESADIRRRRS